MGDFMRLQTGLFSLSSLIFLGALASYGATITGTVKGTEGAPFQGAFVEAQNTKSRITTIVLSDSRGQYQIDKLPAGEYRLQIRAVGFRTDPQMGDGMNPNNKVGYFYLTNKSDGTESASK
jgi:Carboxypeptidase regulatory-like domain